MIEKNLKKLTAAVFFLTFILLKLVIGPVTCNSGWKSPSIGRSGACSHNGGVASWKGFLPVLLSGGAAFWFYVSFSPKNISISPNVTPPPAPAPAPAPGENNNTQPNTPPPPRKPRKPKSQVRCPKCSSPMSLRTAKKGKNPGSKFWGCNKYPRCKGTKPYAPE